MQQVMDFFDLLTDQNNSSVVWNLTFASTNSPFTAEGVPVDLRTQAGAFGLISPHLEAVERGLRKLEAGEPLYDDFPREKREVAVKMLKRNLNGIGRTEIDLGDDVISIVPRTANRALEVIQPVGDQVHDYLFRSFACKEVGSIEGRIIDLGTDHNQPSVKLREQRTGREIQCRVSEEARAAIERSLTAGDVWQHRRVRVRGVLSYDASGKVLRLYEGSLAYIDPPSVQVDDLKDESFTDGLPAHEYLERLREGRLG